MQMLRRTSFGYTAAKLESALSEGFKKTVDRLLETKPVEPPVLAAAGAPGGRFSVALLQQWWLDHIVSTATTFGERLMLFWHGIFTIVYRNVGDDNFL